MLKVRSGNLEKLGLLFERYNRRLFSYFYRLTYRRDLSEDLVQGVFERIIKYRHTYNGGDAFSTWIYSIARNLHIDHHRKNGRLKTASGDFDFNELQADTDNDEPIFGNPEDPRIQLLEAALNKLDPIKKETLVLSRYEGFKYKEIAEIMECSESAVKVRIYRAMKELRTFITELEKADNDE